VNAAAWVADSRFQTKPEPFGLAKFLHHFPYARHQGCQRSQAADDRSQNSNRI